MNLETANEKARKAQQIADSLSQEVSSLQSNYQQSENNRLTLEKQVKCILYLYYEYRIPPLLPSLPPLPLSFFIR